MMPNTSTAAGASPAASRYPVSRAWPSSTTSGPSTRLVTRIISGRALPCRIRSAIASYHVAVLLGHPGDDPTSCVARPAGSAGELDPVGVGDVADGLEVRATELNVRPLDISREASEEEPIRPAAELRKQFSAVAVLPRRWPGAARRSA